MPFDFSALFPGMEAIDFQNSSKIGKDLEALFQSILDFKETIDYSKCGPSDGERRYYKIKKTCEYVASRMTDFVKIARDDLNISIRKMCVYGGPERDISDNIYSCCNISGMNFGMAINSRHATGAVAPAPQQLGGKGIALVNLFAELAKYIDLKNGKMKSTQMSESTILKLFNLKSLDIYVTEMGMDANTLFLLEEFVPENIAKPFTAKEITACILHEFGHIMATVEHAADFYVVTERIKNCAVNTKAESLEEADNIVNTIDKKVLPAVQTKITELKKDNKLDVVTIGTAIAVTGFLANLISKMRKITCSSPTSSVFSNIKDIILSAVNVVIHGLVTVTAGLMLFVTNAVTLDLVEKNYNEVNAFKDSDRKNTWNNAFLEERWADEFSTRQGYGSYLISGLNKIKKSFAYAKITPSLGPFIAYSSTAGNIVSLFIWANTKIDLLNKFRKVHTYEDQFYRARRIVQNMKQRFKEEKIPSALCDTLLNELNNAEKQLDSIKPIEHTGLLEAMGNVVDNIINPATWYEILKDGKMNRDFAILQDKLDDISSNKLYALSHQLSNIQL